MTTTIAISKNQNTSDPLPDSRGFRYVPGELTRAENRPVLIVPRDTDS
ncbi:hypothetical protein GCM10010381_36320 [Streptomyces xantholiticus]|nr:hypothetical protein GCM10010381_36320 [Streptomyces xantholiticus]